MFTHENDRPPTSSGNSESSTDPETSSANPQLPGQQSGGTALRSDPESDGASESLRQIELVRKELRM